MKVQMDSLRIKDSTGNWLNYGLMTIVDTAFSDSYIKAGHPSNFTKVIKISSHASKHDDLVH